VCERERERERERESFITNYRYSIAGALGRCPTHRGDCDIHRQTFTQPTGLGPHAQCAVELEAAVQYSLSCRGLRVHIYSHGRAMASDVQMCLPRYQEIE
jgi:hypothetical protein